MWGAAGEEKKEEEGGAAASWTPSGGGSFTMGSDPSLASPQASATVDALSGLFSQTLGSATANHHHYSKTRLADFKKINEEQGKKRERFLRKQKKARRDLTQYARSLALGPQEGEEEEEEEKDEGKEETAETQNRRSRTERRERRNHRDLYRDQLMLPEPMLDIPEDLALIQQKEGGAMVESRWFAVPYPIGGKRCLVISSNGKTTAYLRNGSVLNRFSSNLPAGGGTSSGRSNGGGGGWRKLHNYCILDCVFEEGKGIYYVLDVVCWKGHLYYDCDTSFRVYWRNTKLMEDAEHATRRMEQNPFPFVPMPFYDCCDPHSIAVAAAKAEEEEQQAAVTFQREALLFYHKDSHYCFGATPLLTYLPIVSVDALLEVFRQRLHLVSAATTPEASAGMAVVPS